MFGQRRYPSSTFMVQCALANKQNRIKLLIERCRLHTEQTRLYNEVSWLLNPKIFTVQIGPRGTAVQVIDKGTEMWCEPITSSDVVTAVFNPPTESLTEDDIRSVHHYVTDCQLDDFSVTIKR